MLRVWGVVPGIRALKVTFNMDMGGGMSWTGGGPAFPNIPDGAGASWSADKRPCTLPVTLEPGHSYRLGLNSLNHNNFQPAGGVQIQPVVYEFQTR